MTGFKLNAEQLKAATTLEGPVSISAGAGSGKTRVLAERCANAVVPGEVLGWHNVALNEVLAITFTEKAAGELAERVRRTLRERGESTLSNEVDSAWISTIHGMCARILRASALEAGLNPSFAIQDTVEAARCREQAFESAARSHVAEHPQSGLFAEYPFGQIASAVFALTEDLRRQGVSPQALRRERVRTPSALCIEAIALFRDASARMSTCSAPPEIAQDHRSACEVTQARLEALLESDLEHDETACILWRILTEHRVPRTSKGLKDIKEDVCSAREALIAEVVSAATAAYCSELLELGERYSTQLSAAKATLGALDFDDLQHGVVGLFEQRPDVAENWRKTFRLSMVDEFQDTDQQQLRIVRSLAGENLCTVGDALQSIYRFRGADISVYRKHNEDMHAAGAASIRLAQNYRSHGQILTFVNKVFGSVVGNELVELQPGRPEPEPAIIAQGHRVELLVAPKDKASPARAALAHRIAARIAEVHEDDDVPLGDIVVLLRSYTHASVYAAALQSRGIDAVVVGGNRFLEMTEVGVLQSLCRVLADGQDEEALGVVLASPLCGLSDDGLLALRTHADERGTGLAAALHSVSLGEADMLRRNKIVDVLEEGRALLGARPLGEILLRAFEHSGWDVDCLARSMPGLQSYATILKLARMADAFESSGSRGPAAFAEHLDAKRRFGDHESPAAVLGEGSGAVRIMSIHASKGLEFPVVVVPELDGTNPPETGIARWTFKPASEIAMQLPSSWGDKYRAGAWFERIKEANRQADSEEYLRLFYVAFTRARELLILAGRNVGGSSGPMINTVLGALGVTDIAERFVTGEGFGPVWLEPVPVGEAQEDEPETPAAPTDAEVRAWMDIIRVDRSRPAHVEPPPERLSYSGLSRYAACPRRFDANTRLRLRDRVPASGAGMSASDFGSAVHAALQIGVSAADQPAIDRVARHHLLDDDMAKRLADICAAYTSSDVAAHVAAWGGVARKEVPFALRVGPSDGDGFVLDGSIDLYCRNAARALIVDYKTGTSGSADELGSRYELQARCYALAALRDGATEVNVVFVRPEVVDELGRMQRVEFVFTHTDRDTIEADLLGRYALMAAGEYSARDRRDELVCRGCPVERDCPAPR